LSFIQQKILLYSYDRYQVSDPLWILVWSPTWEKPKNRLMAKVTPTLTPLSPEVKVAAAQLLKEETIQLFNFQRQYVYKYPPLPLLF